MNVRAEMRNERMEKKSNRKLIIVLWQKIDSFCCRRYRRCCSSGFASNSTTISKVFNWMRSNRACKNGEEKFSIVLKRKRKSITFLHQFQIDVSFSSTTLPLLLSISSIFVVVVVVEDALLLFPFLKAYLLACFIALYYSKNVPSAVIQSLP